jgi:hypothetical protein
VRQYFYKREQYVALFESSNALNDEGQEGWRIAFIERYARPDSENFVFVTYMRLAGDDGRYEYKRVVYDSYFESVEAFNLEGASGWEIVATERVAGPGTSNQLYVIYMRRSGDRDHVLSSAAENREDSERNPLCG